MNLRAYKTSGVFVRALQEALRLEIRVTGQENLTDRPTLFVVNHFTRFETLIIPYVLFRNEDRPVRTLATASLFKGVLGRYLRSCGVMSTRDPHRNRTITRQLMTGEIDWVIYPEGGLVKTKKTMDRGRLRLDLPHRRGPPHTGGAVLALKSERLKREYRRAVERDDQETIDQIEERYEIGGVDRLAEQSTTIIPVTITYYPMRYDHRVLVRAAKLFRAKLTPKAEEELRIEGALLGNAGMSVHFGKSIDVSSYLTPTHQFLARLVRIVGDHQPEDPLLGRLARRLTDRFMRDIYRNLEVNFDHLFATALRLCPTERISLDRFRSVLYLAAAEAVESDSIRHHPTLTTGLAALLTGEPYEPFDHAERLATREGIVSRDNGDLVIDHAALRRADDFDDVRLNNMTGVIANEAEPAEATVRTIRGALGLRPDRLRLAVGDAAARRDVWRFRIDHGAAEADDHSMEIGEPYMLGPKTGKIGVILVHGYLAAPQEMRPLAEYLGEQGYVVYGARLHGHGTSPDQLKDVSYVEWMDSIRRAFVTVKSRCDKVVIGGSSLGGLLALLAASSSATKFDGVFTINAPLKLRDRRAFLSTLAARADAITGRLGLGRRHFFRSNEHTESPDINYKIDYLRGLAELRRAASECRRRLKQITAPALVIQSEADPVVDPTSAEIIHDNVASADRQLVPLPTDRHIVVRGGEFDAIFERIAEFIAHVGGDDQLVGSSK